MTDQQNPETGKQPSPQAVGDGGQAVPRPGHAVTVEIYDQTYHLHGEDPAYIAHLAQLIDSKMRAVAAQGKTVDSLRVAVLAALNVADELVASEERCRALSGNLNAAQSSIRSRTHSLAGLLDSVLEGALTGT